MPGGTVLSVPQRPITFDLEGGSKRAPDIHLKVRATQTTSCSCFHRPPRPHHTRQGCSGNDMYLDSLGVRINSGLLSYRREDVRRQNTSSWSCSVCGRARRLQLCRGQQRRTLLDQSLNCFSLAGCPGFCRSRPVKVMMAPKAVVKNLDLITRPGVLSMKTGVLSMKRMYAKK